MKIENGKITEVSSQELFYELCQMIQDLTCMNGSTDAFIQERLKSIFDRAELIKKSLTTSF